METMIDVTYEGEEALLVYFMPAKCKGLPPHYKAKGKRQYPEDMCYLSFYKDNRKKIVPYKDIKQTNKL